MKRWRYIVPAACIVASIGVGVGVGLAVSDSPAPQATPAPAAASSAAPGHSDSDLRKAAIGFELLLGDKCNAVTGSVQFNPQQKTPELVGQYNFYHLDYQPGYTDQYGHATVAVLSRLDPIDIYNEAVDGIQGTDILVNCNG